MHLVSQDPLSVINNLSGEKNKLDFKIFSAENLSDSFGSTKNGIGWKK